MLPAGGPQPTPARRVVITGIGAITALGCGRDALWKGVLAGLSPIRPVSRFDASAFRSQLAAEVDPFDPLDYLDARQVRRMDRFAQFAVAATLMAADDAGLRLAAEAPERVAVYLGTALGGVAFAEDQHCQFVGRGLGAVEPSLALSVFGGAGATNVAIELGITGPALGNTNSCASGAVAIGEALRLLRSGAADLAFAGGVEAPLAPLTFGAFARIKAMSTHNTDPARACRPFDAERDGFVMGEGAGVLVLETLAHATARDARVYAELLGYGTTNDAYHMVTPLPSGVQAARAISLALADGGLRPADVDYVNAHGSSTPLGDRAEAVAIRQALGPAADDVPVSATKPLYGHPLGASGAIETAITALALDCGFLPATPNLRSPSPDVELRHVPPGGLRARARYALNNACGFGGINACLALGAWHA